MFKPFEYDYRVTDMGFEDTGSSVLSFDFADFYVPAYVLAAAPVMASGDIIKMIAEAAVSTAADNGHLYTSDGDGCACCGHDQGFDYKAEITSLVANMTAAFSSGLVGLNVQNLAEFAAEAMSVDTVDVVDTFKGNLDTFAAESSTTLNMVDSVPGDSSTTATLAIGGSVSGTRETSNDADWYQVDLVAGQTYTFIMLRDGANPHEDPLMQLIGTNGVTVVATNDDIDSDGDGRGDNRNSLITYTATETGTFFVSAEGWDVTTGDYTVYAELGSNRPDFTLDQSAFFLTHQFDNAAQWGSTNLTYDVSGLPSGAQTLAILALNAWADVSGLTFTASTGGSADITFENTDPDGAYASTSSTNGVITSSTINIPVNWSGGNLDLNSYTYQTYLHEVGHALGLGHGGPYNGDADFGVNRVYNQDAWNYTVMSYFDQTEANTGTSRLVLGLQLVDIIAIQNLYGANASGTRSTDTVYGFNVTADVINSVLDFENTFDDNGIRPPSLTIYDTGGTDTLDFSGYNTIQTISLVQETFSSIGDNTSSSTPEDALQNVISIARGTDIENVIGGGGADTITGNDLDNEITGFFGNDIIDGGDGTDVAIYSGNESQYDVTDNGDGTFTVQGLGGTIEGTDTLTNIETLRFADGDVTIGQDTSGPTFTENADVLDGTEGDDVLNALGGDDVVNGLGGNDTITGDAGDDTLTGGAGNDNLSGGVGNDTLDGGVGDDIVTGDAGDDIITFANGGISVGDSADGGAGNDTFIIQGLPTGFVTTLDMTAGTFSDGTNTLTAANFENFDGSTSSASFDVTATAGVNVITTGSGDDVIAGLDGEDVINSGSGADTVRGGNDNDNIIGNLGDDNLYGDAGDDVVNGGAGDDRIFGGEGNDTLIGGGNADFMRGNNGDDVMVGGNGDDRLLGDDGNDELIGGFGNDELFGGEGRNTVDGDEGNDSIFGGSDIDVLTGGLGDDSIRGAAGNDRIFGNEGVDFLRGDDGNDRIEAGDGKDRVEGGNGNDDIFGGQGNDVLLGDGGIDEIYGDAGNDQIFGGAGRDTLYGGDGIDRIVGGIGDDFLRGEADNDRLTGEDGNDRLIGDAGDDDLFGGAGMDEMFGGDGNDLLIGGDGDDTMFGDAGADVIGGGLGNDTIRGNADNDRIKGDDGDDFIRGDEGDDRLEGGNGEDLLLGGDGDDDIFGGNDNDTIGGGNGADDIFGQDGNDTINGEAGNDKILGGNGDDTIRGNADNDLLYGGAGNDFIRGDDGADRLEGGSGEDRLDGGAGNDDIFGGNDDDILLGRDGNDDLFGDAGNDTIYGGLGSDRMTGGAGNDTFEYVQGDGYDRILDFEIANDVVNLVGTSFNSFADIQAAMVDQSGYVLLNLGDGNFLRFEGLTSSDFTSTNFTIGGSASNVDKGDVSIYSNVEVTQLQDFADFSDVVVSEVLVDTSVQTLPDIDGGLADYFETIEMYDLA